MKITSLLAAVLLTACIIVPSVAGAVEIHLLCGKDHMIVDPENQKAFGRENKVVTDQDGDKWVTRVTINSEVYMAEEFFPDGGPMTRYTLNRVTGILTFCMWSSGQGSCSTCQCQKISGSPKF